MDAERNSRERRSGIYRALGDPGRLAVIDALLVGDASPSRLQRELGMSSNLLAHHVDVLEEAGLVRRVRSQGDRRRTYLTLVPGFGDELVPAGVARVAARVVFVCTENSARSQLAAALWAGHSEVPAASAGTHPATRVHPGAVAAARRHQVALTTTRPRRLDEVFRTGDMVITVCDQAHEELAGHPPGPHWSIPDPARAGTTAAFDTALSQLTERVTRVAPAITPTTSRTA
jgi:ArsR family transcriptional regulator, arsenate/arsenite/antimonite-responsive transcriptional repressor / arsenate reductase (thioredoxin)